MKNEDFYFVKVVKEWLNYELGPDYKWTEKPDLSVDYGGCEALVRMKIKIKKLFN